MNEQAGNPWSGLEEFLPETLAPALLLNREQIVVAISPNRARLKTRMSEQAIGAPFASLIQSSDQETLQLSIADCHQSDGPCRLRTRWRDHETAEGDPAVSLLLAALGEWTVVLIERRDQIEAFQEVLDQRAELLSIHREIANVTNADCGLAEAVECVLRRIARFNGWQFGHGFLFSRDQPGKLELISTAYSAEQGQLERFSEFSSLIRNHEKHCLPARVAAESRPILIEDCRPGLNPELATLAEDLQLRSAFGFPILINHDVVGVLEFFSAETIHAKNKTELDSIAAIGLQLGRVVERERSRRARQKSEEHLRLMTRQLRDAVWTYDPGTLEITYRNPALAQVWHLDRERLIENGEAWIKQVVDRDQSRARRSLSELHRGKALDEELRITTATGEIRWIRVRCFPINDDDRKLTSIAATAEDISNYKESRAARASLEKQLRQVAEDERQKAARDLHDDLGGLLSAIGMRLEVLRQNGRKQNPSPDEEAVETIAKLAEQAMATTRRLTRGLAPVGDDPDDLRLALRELADNIRSRGEIQCHLKAVEIPDMPPGPIANQLFRIAHEAVTNAVKHSGGDTVEIHLFKERGDLVLQVIDNGRGLEGGDKKKQKSSGYGLGTMRYRAEDIGADFHTGPGPDGSGLCISCRLPAAAIAPTGEPTRPEAPNGNSLAGETKRDLQVD